MLWVLVEKITLVWLNWAIVFLCYQTRCFPCTNAKVSILHRYDTSKTRPLAVKQPFKDSSKGAEQLILEFSSKIRKYISCSFIKSRPVKSSPLNNGGMRAENTHELSIHRKWQAHFERAKIIIIFPSEKDHISKMSKTL